MEDYFNNNTTNTIAKIVPQKINMELGRARDSFFLLVSFSSVGNFIIFLMKISKKVSLFWQPPWLPFHVVTNQV